MPAYDTAKVLILGYEAIVLGCLTQKLAPRQRSPTGADTALARFPPAGGRMEDHDAKSRLVPSPPLGWGRSQSGRKQLVPTLPLPPAAPPEE